MTKNTGNDFWSRRKAAVREAEEREAAEREEQVALEKASSLEEMTDEEIYEELELTNPDELEEGDDFKPFLRSVVPERLRRRALRRLWTLNPTLANVDGLVDYGEDFTDSATVIEGLQTAYQVGKGMLKHIESMAEQVENKEQIADVEDSASEADASEVAEAEISAGEMPEESDLHSENEPAFSPKSTHKVALTENDVTVHADNSDDDLPVDSVNWEAEPIASTDEVEGTHRRRMRFSFS